MVVNMYAHVGVKFIYLFFLWRCGLTRAMASAFLRIRDHTQRRTIFNSTPTDEWSFRRRDLYLITHKSHKRQTSMPPAGFEQTIQARKRPLLHDLDRPATGVDMSLICDNSVATQNLTFLSYWYRKNVCRCNFDRCSINTQFAKLTAGEQLCRRCTYRKL